MATIQTVGIAGAGTMGSGIAHVFARSGMRVILCDVEQNLLDRALSQIRANLGREAAKGKLAEADVEAAVGRIVPVTDHDALAGADFAIEAATERGEVEGQPVSPAGSHSSPRRDPAAHQHVIDFDHQAGRADAPPPPGDRHAFL